MRTGPALLVAMAWSVVTTTHAQPFPARAVRIIVPFTAGGGVDIVARTLAQKLSESMNQPFVIDNRAGAGGNIGIEAAARAPADGYTLLMASSAMTINPAIYKVLRYDPAADFAPVSQVSVIPLVLVTNPTVPVKSLRELATLARNPTARLTYATSGVGNSTHLAMELLKMMTQTQMLHVPYKATAQKNMDVISGQVDMMFAAPPSVTAHIRARQMRALAVSGARRSSVLPDLPTVAEAGVPGYDFVSWNGLFAPAGTSAEVINRLNQDVGKALANADIRTRLAGDGADPAPNSPSEFSAYVKSEIAKYAKLVAAVGIPRE